MEYLTKTFQKTPAGLRQKDEQSRILASQGFRIIGEHIEQGHIKGEEACCGFLICAPLAFLAGRTSGNIIVTYGREVPLNTTGIPAPPIAHQFSQPQASTYRNVPSSPVAITIGFSLGQAVAWLTERPLLLAGLILLLLLLIGFIAYH
jgi:hypothetical protein